MTQKEKIKYNLKQYFLQNNIPFTDDNLYELLKSGKLLMVRNIGKASEQEIIMYLSNKGYDCSFQSSCETCNLDNYEKDFVSGNILVKELASADYLDLSLCYDKQKKVYFLRAIAANFAYYQIKYCPDCGRKLN